MTDSWTVLNDKLVESWRWCGKLSSQNDDDKEKMSDQKIRE